MAGLLLIFVSCALYVYDLTTKEEDLLFEVSRDWQRDFEACVAFHSGKTDRRPSSQCEVCELVYENGNLRHWSDNRFLPQQQFIDNLEDMPDDGIVELGGQVYFQIRERKARQVIVKIIPLYITYPVRNNVLAPYLFLGRWADRFYQGESHPHIRRLQVIPGPTQEVGDLQLFDPNGQPLLTLNNVPTLVLRSGIRYAVLLFLGLGILVLAIFLRIYALHRYRFRYLINAFLFGGVLLLRGLLYWIRLPGDYIPSELFSPDILAFHALAPSLGDLTLNIITLTVLVWIAYTHFFRISNLFFRRLIRNRLLSWVLMLAVLALASVLLDWYVDVFEAFYVNSQVDIEFSNILRTNIHSYLILLDSGLLLLSISLIIFSLLKIHVLYFRRYGLSVPGIMVQVLFLLVMSFLLHKTSVWLMGLMPLAIMALAIVVYRIPFRPILHHDLTNYFAIILVFSILVTYNVVIGVNLTRQFRAEQIARTVLGTKTTNTVVATVNALNNIAGDMPEVQAQLRKNGDMGKFRDWLIKTYFTRNFNEFDVYLYIYDAQMRRLDQTDGKNSAFDLASDIPIEARGERVSKDIRLYQLPNSENEYLDQYVGVFDLDLDLGGDSVVKTHFLIELIPNRRETQGLYPSLTLDQSVYDEISLINAFDHAVYYQNILSSKRGKSSFPVYMPDQDEYRGKTNRRRGEYLEYLEPIGGGKLVVVRYTQQRFFDIVTTFSFIFYFFVLTALGLIVLPVMLMRSLRSRKFAYEVPLRSKIRIGLLAISILPMVVIIALLYPFIADRYNEEARKELGEDAAKMTEVLGPLYQQMRTDFLGRLSLSRDFEKELADLERVVKNDINIYDERGRHLASTQPMIFEMGIKTDLMNPIALDSLSTGQLSDLVLTERIGTQDYLSAYRPIMGNNKPIGYINIPYITRQDQLEDQVINFLAYLANIYLLTLLLLNFVSVAVAGTITRPLSMIRQRLAATNLGGTNEPLEYKARDEIGAIVSAYNQMVTQLSDSEKRLSQNQRELAWRQMARQVAHEIKNPLTPMKLSIQHLMRTWDEKSGRFEKMFPKVMQTLMTQIESMVRIANSFSEFARMPDPVKSRMNLNQVLLEVVDLYAQSEEAIWLIDVPQENFYTIADRDQLSRCFNNIIKNGLQAVEEDGIMHISMRILEDRARIEIKDNGKGIPEELQGRVFEPSFSTKSSGMGLGLAIVKRIIENTGGTISFRSRVGEGTTFIIEIPNESVEYLEEVPEPVAG
ncbi:MAG: hypothetical protein OHK0039_15600 [Bacteroidia bacterium]